MKAYYEHAGITIYHGDCREILPQLPVGFCTTCNESLGDEQLLAIHLAGEHEVRPAFDLLLTDPPYGILSENGSAATRRSGGNRDDGIMAWDIAPSKDLVDRLRRMSLWQAIWGGCHLELPPTLGYLVWDKQIDGLNFGETEFCWTNGKFAPRLYRYRAVGVDGGKVHPTQKPVDLMKWTINKTAPGAASILDPFMGSGTSLIAAKDQGKSAIGIEINEEYCEVAAKRLSQEVLDFSGAG